MKYFNHLYKVVLGFYLYTALVATAATPALATKDELVTQKELLQIQIDSKNELLRKDIEFQNRGIEALNKRIDDQISRVGDVGAAVDRYGVATTYVGLAITILLVGIGFLGYRAARSDAKEAAKDETQKWFEQNKKLFAEQLQEIESSLKDALNKIDIYVQTVKDHSIAAGAEIQSAMQDMLALQQQINEVNSNSKLAQMKNIGSSVDQLAEELKTRPENSYSFHDWNARAFAAYKEGKLEDAAYHWDKAAEMPNVGAINSAQSLLNKAAMLTQLDRKTDAINVYDLLIQKFEDTSDVMLLKQVAQAMLHKSATLNQLGRQEEELTTYDMLLQKFGGATEAELSYFVAIALNSKGFKLLCRAKFLWAGQNQAIDLLEQAKSLFQQALDKNPNGGFPLGNLAYVAWLLGDRILAEQYFREALLKSDAGEVLYRETLTDFEIYSIEPDNEFKVLVEKLWEELQQN